jgi:hypothetical protein
MRTDLPGGEWAEIKPVEDLTGADQDAYFDSLDAARARRDAEAEAAPLPEGGVRPKGTLTNGDYRGIRDQAMGKLITAWSFDGVPLPYSTASRASLPLYACNALVDAVDDHVSALNGAGPKAAPTGTGSSDTSDASTSSLPLEPLPAP